MSPWAIAECLESISYVVEQITTRIVIPFELLLRFNTIIPRSTLTL